MRRLRAIVPLVCTLVAVGCGSDDGGMPRGWGPLARGVGEHCPEVAGRYFDSSGPISWLLAGRHLDRDGLGSEWAYFELAGSADTALTVTVLPFDGDLRTARLRKGGPYGGDYYCEDGWLKVNDRSIPDTWDDAVHSGSFVPRRREVRMAPGATGTLVARLDFIDYGELTVWCGDGCKGIPLPWTFETRSSWSAVERWAVDEQSPRAAVRSREEDRREAERRRLERDPLYREVRALENGPAIAGEQTARDRATAALVPGMLLRGVGSRGEGWNLSVQFADSIQLADFMQRLSQGGSVAEIGVAPLYRGRTTDGQWTDVVFVRFAP